MKIAISTTEHRSQCRLNLLDLMQNANYVWCLLVFLCHFSLSLMCISFFVNLFFRLYSVWCDSRKILRGDSQLYHIKAITTWNFVTCNHKTFKNFRSLSIIHQTNLVSFLFVYVRFVLSFFLYLRPHKSFTKSVLTFNSFNHFVFIIFIPILLF